MRKIKYFIEQSWLLIAAAFFFGLLLALTNAALEDKIRKNEIGALYDKMKNLMPQAQDFKKVIEQAAIGGNITDVYKATGDNGNTIGYSFIGTGSGFADKIKLVIAVNENCSELLGFRVLSSNETPGFGSRITEEWFQSQFDGAPVGKLQLSKDGAPEKIDDEIIALTGATVSSDAVVSIFNNHIDMLKQKLQEKGFI